MEIKNYKIEYETYWECKTHTYKTYLETNIYINLPQKHLNSEINYFITKFK